VLDEQRDEIYPQMRRLGASLMHGLREEAAKAGVPLLVAGPGPLLQMYFTERESIGNYRDYAGTELATAGRIHLALMDEGINIVPRGLWFLSTEHTEDHIAEAVSKFGAVLKTV
jgi:glutamate-1-semialdehyde 2,1-aminomutase